MDETAQRGEPAPAEPKELPADGTARGPQAAAEEAAPQAARSAASADAASLSSVIDTARAATDDLAAVFDSIPDKKEARAQDPVADGSTAQTAVARPDPCRVEDLPKPAAEDPPSGEASPDRGATPAGAAGDRRVDIALAEAARLVEPPASAAPSAGPPVPQTLEDLLEPVEQPSADAPESSAPEPSVPEPSAPEAGAPEASSPEVGAPEPSDVSAPPAPVEARTEAAEPAVPEERVVAAPSAPESTEAGVTEAAGLGDRFFVEPVEQPSAHAPESSAPEPSVPEPSAPEAGAAEAGAPEPSDVSAPPAPVEARTEAAEPAVPEERVVAAPSAPESTEAGVTEAAGLGDTFFVKTAPEPAEGEAAPAAHPIVEDVEAHDRFQEGLEAAQPGIAAAPAANGSAGSDEPAAPRPEASLDARPAENPGAELASVPFPGRPAEAAIVAIDAAPGPALDGRAADADRTDRQDAAPGAGEPPVAMDAGPPTEPAGQPEPVAAPGPGARGAVEQVWSATPAVSPPLGQAPALVAPAPVAPAGPRPASPAWRMPPAEDLVRLARPWVRRALRGAAVAAAGLAAIVLVLIVAYRWVDPPISTLMLGQSLAGTPIERTWVPIERVSPNLIRAVVLSEDAAFCRHRGVDWRAIEEAMEDSRGGSTITMQVVKNLFLWPSRSYVRKAIEIALAYLVEAVWSKRRIMEIYLNIAEWGDGIFGAEAAARAHFDKHAARLTVRQAALLAVSLPNPIERTPAAPSLGTGRLASRLMLRMATARPDLSCLPVPRRLPRSAPKKAPLVPGP